MWPDFSAARVLCVLGTTALSSIVVTDQRPQASFVISSSVLKSAPSSLYLRVTKVHNPTTAGIALFVFVESVDANQNTIGTRTPLGNVALFPADSPSGFILPVGHALAAVGQGANSSGELRLVIEIRPLHRDLPFKDIELTIAPPEWRS